MSRRSTFLADKTSPVLKSLPTEKIAHSPMLKQQGKVTFGNLDENPSIIEPKRMNSKVSAFFYLFFLKFTSL